MNRTKIIFFFIVSISILFLLTSCGAIVKSRANKYLTEENGAIPPEFGKESTTMLFVTHHKSYNRYLKRNVQKIYEGEYEFISQEEFLLNSKFKDTNKYRFVFNFDYKSYSYVSSDGSFSNGSVKKFYVIDRKNNKRYSSKLTSGYWSKLQKVYLKKLNEKLKIG